MIKKNRSLTAQIMILAGPAILEMLMHTLVWTADTAMVGRLTAADIAAVNLGAHIMFTSAMIFGALGTGATAMVARHIGAGEEREASRLASQAVSIGIIISILIGTSGMLASNWIFESLVDDPEVVALGSMYLRIVMIGVFFLIPQMIGNAIIRGSGNTFVPFISALVANVFNIAADYVLIFGKMGFPAMGSRGAAIATGTAQILGAAVTFYFLFSQKGKIKLKLKEMHHFELGKLKKLYRLSIPAGLEVFMNEGSRLLSSFWIAQLGTIAYAAHSLSVAAESVSFMPGYGFAVAAATMVGQHMGAGNLDMALKSTRRSIILAAAFMGSIGTLFFVFPFQIMRLFSNQITTVQVAAECLRIGAFEQVPIAIAMVTSGALKGAGDTKGPFGVSLITNLGVRLPLIFVAVFILELPVTYIWWISVAQYILEALLMTLRYRRGYWKSIKL
ncbi:MAG: MATE family efflux transporter [Tindallia sp. MSAO_Bac2]|nr:MAG: MATE family efflux transporter [Tindallia sp. MSAO_Bac2]